MQPPLPLDQGLFGRLRREAAAAWRAYVTHDFVEALGTGALEAKAFRRYLTQDYLFLIQFARAYALAGYKSASLSELRAASRSVAAILDVEMPLHVGYCSTWGLSEADMAAEPEALETIAYTRFVLERGLCGDMLDLQVSLAPCIIGYAEIAERLAQQQSPGGDNPYAAWIETYASAEYRALATAAMEMLDILGQTRATEARYAELLTTFNTATRLEAAFWSMGLAES